MRSTTRFVCLIRALFACGSLDALARDLYFADGHGNKILVAGKSVGRFATPATPTRVVHAGILTWNITFDDVNFNNNRGFDDPVHGEMRQDCALQVLLYIGSVLNVDTNVAVDVKFTASEIDGSGYLATAGTLWWGDAPGFDNGFAFEHITTGTDPDPESIDIECTVDFGWNWNSDPSVPPTGAQVDLYSVLLHEMTHGLGVLSLSDNLGRGLMNTNPDVYTVWDRLMQFGAGNYCWNSGTTDLQVATSAFTSDNLFFSGSNATTAYGSRPPIYAPATYNPGSSLAHFKTGSVDSVMEHAISFGVAEREYSAVDIGTLRDIGYSNAAPPVAVAPNPDFTATPTSGNAPLTVQFTDLSSNFPTSWAWDFDNDSVVDSTLQNPFHTYTAPGSYTVTLTAGNAAGANSASKVAFITVTLAPVETTVTVSQDGWAFEGDGVTFTATATGAMTYQWYHDGVLIPGATGSTFTIPAAGRDDSGSYYCEMATASHGVVTTDSVTLIVIPASALPTAGWIAGALTAAAVAVLAAVLEAWRRRQVAR